MTNAFHRRSDFLTEDAYQIFFEALKKDSIDELVQAAYHFWGFPVLLTDENYKLICQHPDQPIGQNIWDTLYHHKVLPVETIQDYQNMYLDAEARYYKPFYSADGLAADCPRIFGEVYSENRIYGHIAIFLADAPLLPDDIRAANIFIDALKMLMIPRKKRENASLASYMYDLLDPNTPPQVKALALRSLSPRIPGPFAIMVTPIGQTVSQQAFAPLAASQIPDKYRATVSTLYQNCIVTLFGLMRGDFYTEKEISFFQRVAADLAPSDASSGVSQPFTELTQFSGRFQQAYLTALATDKPCEFFDFIYPAQIFEAVSLHMDADMLIHPVLKKLLAYDQTNQTEYFRTLQVYSMTLHNKESSARILGIHRNTLLYRLNKIHELFHIPYEEQQIALALLNSFQLMESGLKPHRP